MNSMFAKFKILQRPYANGLQEVLSPFQMSEAQWGLIRYIYEVGPATNSEIALYWSVEKPSVTALAQKLIDQQLIYVVYGTDKRKKVMHLTENGIAKYQQLKEAVHTFQSSLLEGITKEECEIVEKVLEKLQQNIRK
ncbi:DNA-binding transcriptional regulator, MarR family [Paenisporosarcina quisquiliarum]|uniref:MarR family winged helix-turn-helix transcriptional regulator n=1 Tax=Psychrobacillus TaxID=1221880 RepID=UPI0008D178AF|nr:MarR family transcriptional regulator [Psychrobacillus psychrodurans]MCK1996933.1 MarR family transcriptional regulator [Psychrobacillus psychrodurans]MCZ8538738.1 MarR family transcriptional regulator [Psychrobacillus psychrodurans]SEM73266.1 DNA-binding transcriptional regulator, MarR family [Paenisporosarcina quisquiliarum]SFM20915.1 DNA-binding transcriptional regulator, MarR family [Psychrobacillus psychrodurans]